jgi:hypothetical protein
MPILGIMASSFRSTAGPEGAYDSLATITVPSGGVTSVTFTGIPAGYKHLQIRVFAKWNYTTAADFTNIIMRFNSDTTASYSRHSVGGNGSTVAAGAGANESEAYVQTFIPSNHSSETNVFGASIIDILDYSNVSKFKTLRALGGFDRNGSGLLRLASASWRNTNAISSISIYNDINLNWMQYSSFALYGVK